MKGERKGRKRKGKEGKGEYEDSVVQGLESKFLFMNKLEKIPCSRVHERFMNKFKFFSQFFFFVNMFMNKTHCS